MKNIYLLLITLFLITCKSESVEPVTLESQIDWSVPPIEFFASEYDSDPATTYDRRASSLCDLWAQNTGQSDCCFAATDLTTTATTLELEWYAKNCFGNNYRFYFWVVKKLPNGSTQNIGSGASDINKCYQSVFHYFSIPVQPGTYYIFWLVGNQSNQYCSINQTPLVTVY